jgi:predicted DNA-binding transcriptional regulator AlpA
MINDIFSPAEKLLTPTDFQNIFGIPETTQAVWRCTGRYNLPYIKLGRLVRYRRTDVEAWLQERSVGGAK